MLNTKTKTAPSRPPEQVMRLERLGSFHQTRLSFMRVLLRRLKRENWKFERPLWQIDEKGVGRALYTAKGPRRTYSLVVFSHDLDPAKRSDRVIAEEWDATFAFFDGVPGNDDIERLSQNVPKQEAGRISGSELSLSRANRSVRLFEHVLSCLKKGEQPMADELDKVGYLMRTTAVYGSGKFGALDYRFISEREEFRAPYQVEMLSVYLTRAFTVDIVEHLARAAAPETAVKLAPHLRRRLGVGNSTGLGMAPFLANHPVLFNNWIKARETALARVRGLPVADDPSINAFSWYLDRQRMAMAGWNTADSRQQERIEVLRADLDALKDHIEKDNAFDRAHPWDGVYRWAEENLSLEGQECVVGLLIEPFGEMVDALSDDMSADEQAAFGIDGAMKLPEFCEIIRKSYSFALEFDFDDPHDDARFWYVSEEKLEPRLGERYDEPGAERESPLAISRDIALCYQAACKEDPAQTLAAFLLKNPEHRHVARRVQVAAREPYAEIQDNLISADVLPIDLLRCKLSFFGATRFDPRSDRWVRINMFQHAPFPDELAAGEADDWIYPPLEMA